jgi:DNA polymerase-3 subunit alpha
MSTISGLVDKAKKTGMNAIALTDHGNMFGVKEFHDYISKTNKKHKEKINSLQEEIKIGNISDEKKSEILLKIEEEKSKLFKPIIGCEAYVARREMSCKDKNFKEDKGGWHLILLAKNFKGYQNLCKLSSESWLNGFYYKPRIDKNLLEKYSEGLIVCSACLGGEIPQLLLGSAARDVDEDENKESGFEEAIVVSEENIEKAEESIKWFKKVFRDDFYLELQRHKTDKKNANTSVFRFQQAVNKAIVELGKRTDTKIIATNDVHFVEEFHGDAHEILICTSTGKKIDDKKRMLYTKQEWLKTPEEMEAIFRDVPEALNNTKEIKDKIEFYEINRTLMMPKFDVPKNFGTEEDYKEKYSEEVLCQEFNGNIEKIGGYNNALRIKLEADYLEKLTFEGAAKRYGDQLPSDIEERIVFELGVMRKMGFPGYFLIVQDFIAEARKMGVSVGPGRGSAAGSVVAYCLKITDIDPLKYDLLFERFLNPDRISMPDIDIDFDDDGRGKVLKWVTDKYGQNRVAHIITFGTMAAKSSIKDVARVYGLSVAESDRLTKMIPDKLPEDPKTGKSPELNLKNCYEKIDDLKRELQSSNEIIPITLNYAQMLEGTIRQTGVHACGVIIGAEDLTHVVPISTAKDKETGEDVMVTQYEGSTVEEVGLIKMDFLGLKTLNIIKETLSNIKKSKGIDVDIDAIPIDDPEVYELFSAGATIGIFQFESPQMQKYLKDLQPTNFEDIIAMNALYRPGPMQKIPSFINRKHGTEKIEYDFPEMEKRLKATYGITVYQEQVMLLSRDLAGFTQGQSDELRKAMGKKLKDKMDKLEVLFLNGAKAKGFGPDSKLQKIWNEWAEFAKYAFNKSHATCYSWVAYQSAYLKTHYPSEFLAGNLTRNIKDISEVSKFMQECYRMRIKILGPNVNNSDIDFTVDADGAIHFGLAGISHVGNLAAKEIVSERENNGDYKNVYDFVSRINLSTVNKGSLEALVSAGAFDCFPNIKREQYFANEKKTSEPFIETLIRFGKRGKESVPSLFGDEIAVEFPIPENVEKVNKIEFLKKEKDAIGFFFSSHPLDEAKIFLENKDFKLCNLDELDLKEKNQEKNFAMIVLITAIEKNVTKTGRELMRISISDRLENSYSFAIFGDQIKYYTSIFKINLPIYLEASFNYVKKSDRTFFNVENVYNLEEPPFSKLTLIMKVDDITDEFTTEFMEICKDFNKEGKTKINFIILGSSETECVQFVSSNSFYFSKKIINFVEKYFLEGKGTYSIDI